MQDTYPGTGENGEGWPSAFSADYASSFTDEERAHAVKVLRGLFEHDTWTARQGLLLLVGINPRWADFTFQPDMGISDVRTYARITAPVRFLERAGRPEQTGLVKERGVIRDLGNLRDLWISNPAHQGGWDTRHPPAYFIEWARSKGRAPFWLGWLPAELSAAAGLTAGASEEVIKEARLRRLLDRYAELKLQGVKRFTQQLAAEEGVSEGRIRQLLKEARALPPLRHAI